MLGAIDEESRQFLRNELPSLMANLPADEAKKLKSGLNQFTHRLLKRTRAEDTDVTVLLAGSRGSDLALWQTHHVANELKRAWVRRSEPAPEVRIQIIRTRGDTDQSERLVGKLEKGFFTEELEAAIREKRVDFAVHSLKDLPTRLPKDLELAAVTLRAPVEDWLLVRPEFVDESLGPAKLPVKAGARVGASSLRRDALVKRYSEGAVPVPLRGNVPTRVTRLKEGEKVDAILLAGAGLSRLGLDLKAFKVFRLNPKAWPTAPGQGSIAVQCRTGDEHTKKCLEVVDHRASRAQCAWERKFLEVLEGGCATPFGCHVDGAIAWLGQLPPNGGPWRSRAVQLPLGLSDSEQEQFVRQTLDSVFESGEDVHADWIYQPL